MENKENRILRKRLLRAYLSSVLSISLVLLLVGIASLLLVNAGNVSAYFKENMQISVIFRQDSSEKEALEFKAVLDTCRFVKSVGYVSKEQGIKEMQELLGEDFLSVFDTAPIPVSLNLSIHSEYVTTQKMEEIMEWIKQNHHVDDVVWQKSLIEALNANLRTISLVLGIFIMLLMTVSFALIANTVRLNLYNKRFSIHTMRLVGAKKSFIVRPFLWEAVFQGIVSAQVAMLLLVGVLLVVKRQFAELFTVFLLDQLLMVLGIILASGIVICVAVTFIVVSRLVSLKKEELYY